MSDIHQEITFNASAKVTGKRQLTVLAKLLAESRALYPTIQKTQANPMERSTGSDAVSRRIDQVMGEMQAEGWRPRGDDDFDH